jgi:chromosome segregation ATPase
MDLDNLNGDLKRLRSLEADKLSANAEITNLKEEIEWLKKQKGDLRTDLDAANKLYEDAKLMVNTLKHETFDLQAKIAISETEMVKRQKEVYEEIEQNSKTTIHLSLPGPKEFADVRAKCEALEQQVKKQSDERLKAMAAIGEYNVQGLSARIAGIFLS